MLSIRSGRRVGTGIMGAAAATVPLALLVGCSFSLSAHRGGLDYDQLQREIHDKLTAEYAGLGHEPSDVECPHPDPAPKAGDTFECTATVDGDDDLKVRIEVTVGEKGHVDYRTSDTLYDLPVAGQRLSEVVGEDQGFPVTVDCGTGVKIVADGGSFDCQATDPAGNTRTLRLTAGGIDGEDRWELLPQTGG